MLSTWVVGPDPLAIAQRQSQGEHSREAEPSEAPTTTDCQRRGTGGRLGSQSLQKLDSVRCPTSPSRAPSRPSQQYPQ